MNLDLTPTIERFIRSEDFMNVLMGPRGEGKTWGGYQKLIYHAQKTPDAFLPIKVAVIRDTWTNLERTTIDTLREMQRAGLDVNWIDGDTQAIIGGNLAHLYFMGMDRPQKISKLQGFGIGSLWLEEPAPAADLSSGIAAEVLGVGVTSIRQTDVHQWVQVTMNPPDEDHWIIAVRDKVDELLPEMKTRGKSGVRWFAIPRGENPHISWEKRERDKLYLYAIGRGDLVVRLAEGKIGQIILGEPLMPEYGDDVHISKKPLPIIRGVEIVRLWDFGLNPTCVWTQVTPLGHWNILGCVRGENIGLEQLIETEVNSWESFFLHDPTDWMFRDIIDPAGFTREQSSSKRSAANTLIEMLNASPEPGAIEWAERKDSLKAVLTRSGRGGIKLFMVDPDNRIIRRTLRGGAHYPKDSVGRITATKDAYKKASGIHSHPMDCLMIGAAKLFPLPSLHHRPKKTQRRPVATSRRSQGWMGV